MTPYFLAVLQGQIRLAEKLVSAKLSDPKRVNSEGKTITDLAFELCSTKACAYLGLPLPDPNRRKAIHRSIMEGRLRKRMASYSGSPGEELTKRTFNVMMSENDRRVFGNRTDIKAEQTVTDS